jgi:hypothetical protein
VVLLVVVEGYLALASSRNQGVGFRVPLLPGLVTLAVAGIWTLRRASLRGVVAGALVVVCALNLAMKANVSSALSDTETVDVPGLGVTPILQGDGYIHGYVLGAFEARRPSSTEPLPSRRSDGCRHTGSWSSRSAPTVRAGPRSSAWPRRSRWSTRTT